MENNLEELKGRYIYFKSFLNQDQKDQHQNKIGTISEIRYLFEDKESIYIEVMCNHKLSNMVFQSLEQIERSIDIAEQVLLKRRENLEQFFTSGRDKEMIEDLRKEIERKKKINKYFSSSKKKRFARSKKNENKF